MRYLSDVVKHSKRLLTQAKSAEQKIDTETTLLAISKEHVRDQNIVTDTSPQAAAGSPLVLTAMCLGLMLAMFNSSMSSVLIPDIGTEFGSSATTLQWIATVYTLTFAVCLLPGASLGMRVGRRNAFVYGTSTFVLGTAWCMLSNSTTTLLIARSLQAAGVGLLIPQTLAVLVHEYKELSARARAVGIWAAVASIGLVAGPLLGGVAVSVIGWRAGFGISLAIGLAALFLGINAVPAEKHGRPAKPHKHDVIGIILGVSWLTLLVFGLNEANKLGWYSFTIVGCLAAAAIGFVAFIYAQHKMTSKGKVPLMPLVLWKNKKFMAANVAGIAYFVALFGVLYFYSIYFQQTLKLSPVLTGVAFLPLTCIMGLCAYVAGKISGIFGVFNVLAMGLAITALACLFLGALPLDASLWHIEIGLGLIGTGAGLMSATTSNGAISNAPKQYSGIASAVHNTCRQIGSTLGVSVLGSIIHASQNSIANPHNSYLSGLQHAMNLTGMALLICAFITIILSTQNQPTTE